jgi:hypothetical protein
MILLASGAAARDRGDGIPHILQLPDSRCMVHRASNIAFTVTNFGWLGSMDGTLEDPERPGESAPGAEFPQGSEIEYLFIGAIWIGGVIDTVDGQGNPTLDTLVSVGNDGWWGNVNELFPPDETHQSIWRDQIIAEEEIFALYADTLTAINIVYPDPNDDRPHTPLGLSITQHSICWSSPGYDELFIIEYQLENLYSRDIHDLWFGIYYDGDVWHSSENPYGGEQGAQDDLCGFIVSGTPGIAWLADNDGQQRDSVYDYRSPVNVMGMMLAGSSDPAVTTNFNWWVQNTDSILDWGPQLQSNFDRWGIFPGGGRGTPGGDRAKYQVMTNGERDYDQAYAGLDHTTEGWIDNPPHANNIANGFDTRYLVSFGPIQIDAGQVETLTVAFLGGRDLHTNPLNYIEHLQYYTDDPASINEYYNNLSFDDLIAKADSAVAFVARNYSNIPVGPPGNFRITGWGEDNISLAWSPSWHDQIQEYRIYRGTQPGVYDPQEITPDNFTDTAFVDIGLANNTTYYYVITTVRENNNEGGRSREISFHTGIPQIPLGLSAIAGNNSVIINWNPNPEPDIAGYLIHRGTHGGDLTIIDSTDALNYSDMNLPNGIEYDYAIAAYDTFGNISQISERVSAVPMGLDSGILIINATRRGELNPDYDSMTAFYLRAFDGLWFNIIDYPPSGLPLLSNYSTVIWARELPLGQFYISQTIKDLLRTYLENGGKLILAGTRTILGGPMQSGIVDYNPGDFEYDILNLDAIEYPDLRTNTEFIGGHSLSGGFPDFNIDSVRADRILFPFEENYGRLYGIGVLIPNDSSEAIYGHVAVNPDTSHYHGRPVALIHDTPSFKSALLEFPLYYVNEQESILLIREILRRFGEQVDVDDSDSQLPVYSAIVQNYPNPFNVSTVISFFVKSTGRVKLDIFNMLGQKLSTLIDSDLPAGPHRINWNAAALPSGIYFARLEYANGDYTHRMALIK